MKYTLNIPPDEYKQLQDEHARTYAEHRLALAPWLRMIWIRYLEEYCFDRKA